MRMRVRCLFDGLAWRQHCELSICGTQIITLSSCAQDSRADLILDRGMLVPGLVDLQVNGGGGVLLNNQPDREGLQQMVAAHCRRGTTTLLPTLLSDHPDVLQRAAWALRELQRTDPHGPAAGLHVEGPWFASARRGAHAADRLQAPGQADIDRLCALADVVRIITLAPEVMQPGQIQQLCQAGIRVLAGHSDATAAQLATAHAEGLSGFTHLYNAMSQLAPREPGMVGTALAADWSMASLIADGHHVHPEAIRLAARCLGPERLYLVSDAMASAGDADGHFDLYGETLREHDGRLINAEGRLAGSAITLLDALRYAHREAGLPLDVCLRMCTSTPATLLPGAPTGRMAPGQRADLLWLSDDLELLGVWQAGQWRAGIEDL